MTHTQTLWQISGVSQAPSLKASETALLLIDFQHEYAPDGKLPLHGLHAAASTAQRLSLEADRAGVPVVHVHHVARQPGAALFAPGSQGAMPLREPAIGPAHTALTKHWPSAFHDTDLAARLQAQGTRTVVIAGCMTHNCVDSTARAAMHLGFAVVVVPDACATRDLPDAQGRVMAAKQVHEASLAALSDRHAHLIDAGAVGFIAAPGPRHPDGVAAWRQA